MMEHGALSIAEIGGGRGGGGNTKPPPPEKPPPPWCVGVRHQKQSNQKMAEEGAEVKAIIDGMEDLAVVEKKQAVLPELVISILLFVSLTHMVDFSTRGHWKKSFIYLEKPKTVSGQWWLLRVENTKKSTYG